MAADYIAVTKISRPQLGNQLIRAANLTRELRDLIRALDEGGQHMFTGADYTVFEAQFGVTGGANVLNLIGLVNTILNTNADVTGADRLSQLDEFVARLAGQ